MPLNRDQVDFLKKAKLFDDVEAHVIKMIADDEQTSWDTRVQGECLLPQEATTDHSWLLVHGIVAVRRREIGSNKEVHWGFRRPIEQITGTLSVAETKADTSHYIFSAKSDLIKIHRETMVSAMQLSRALIRNMGRSHAYRFEAAAYRVEIARSLKPVQRVAAILVEAGMAVQANLDVNYPSVATLSLTHKELADLAGVNPETLRKTIMPQLKKYLVVPARGKVILADAEAIRKEFIEHISFPGGV